MTVDLPPEQRRSEPSLEVIHRAVETLGFREAMDLNAKGEDLEQVLKTLDSPTLAKSAVNFIKKIGSSVKSRLSAKKP